MLSQYTKNIPQRPFHHTIILFAGSLLLTSAMTCFEPDDQQSDVQGSTVDTPEVDAKISEYMDRMVELGFSGGAFVYKSGEPIVSRGYGMADRESGVEFNESTHFPIGSLTKQFTGAAILKLESQTDVSVDDKITQYFDRVPAEKQSITIHQLLTHSSGLPGAIGFDFAEINREEYIQEALDTELMFAPGSSYEYSNVGYSLLAAIIEQVSGVSYDEYTRTHLFEPAGMTGTGYNIASFDKDRIAHGYKAGEDWGTMLDKTWAPDGPYWHLRGNGGTHSTLVDMYRWHVALEGNQILTDDQKRQYYGKHVDEGQGDSFYGYGWVSIETRHGKVIQHDGGNPYYSSMMIRYPEQDLVVFATSNAAEIKAYNIAPDLARIVLGDSYRLPPLVVETISRDELHNIPVGQTTLATLELFAGAPEDIDEFVDRYMSKRVLEAYPVEDIKNGFREDQRRVGATTLGQIVLESESRIVAEIQSLESGMWRQLTVDVDDDGKIIGLGLDGLDNPSGQNDANQNEATGGQQSQGRVILDAFIAAASTDDASSYEQFIDDHFDPQFKADFSMDMHIQQFKLMFGDFGDSPRIVGAKRPFSESIDAKIQSTSGEIYSVTINLTPQNKINGIIVE